ncbi:hypothetical protein NC653_024380 [Populus alba x Populus x berolinensis]|uniref:Uncharacterized protein n=1 Tax=Populus alba x Populus x berolinensis TaxID=444605 RepID=A0AAD6Q8J6_9ROSI|nr:hypothetical protein NC653_024380 [Populus alba x Populus x berolinensis]
MVTGFDGFSGFDDRMERESGFEKLEDERRGRIESSQKKALDTCSALLSFELKPVVDDQVSVESVDRDVEWPPTTKRSGNLTGNLGRSN